ncbi:XYLA-like protein [Mya arenaria]|uniref:Xylose isomerase n=1 Tax=Mya arenaria TaxID=6604 RepID=A0ABY7GEF7_MYAAR|nr:xylose isomerase-like [Mya arenaria]XP_052787788.1 xylose isomerase-like [Mya arenaria]WAR31934.1 XYLA-like protein [Mya arenaria]
MSSFAPESKGVGSDSDASSYDAEDAVFFPGIDKIGFNSSAGHGETMVYRQYNPSEVVLGRTMEEWLRFSVCFWHTFRGTGADPFGFPTLTRPWDDGSNTLANARRRLRAAFEFFTKLGVKYWTFHDRDISPEGATLEETNKNLDEMADLALKLQNKTGVKLLWGTSNLFANPMYMNGAASNPDAHIFAYAAAQVKKCMEVAMRLGAQNFVFWGGREGYHTLLNTDVRMEQNHLAAFFRMAAAYKKKIGFTGNLLIEPKPKEPAKHQYDYDAMTVIAFLKTYGLDKEYKLNIEPNHTTLAGHGYEHDVVMASAFGLLGSVDSNTGSPDLGWDTDQFPMDVKNSTQVMRVIIEQGGLAPGGLNFDCKVRRESTELRDMFTAHIGAMDTFAKALKVAAAMKNSGLFDKQIKERYGSFSEGIGKKIDEGTTDFEELEAYVMGKGDPVAASGRQEHYETMFNTFL